MLHTPPSLFANSYTSNDIRHFIFIGMDLARFSLHFIRRYTPWPTYCAYPSLKIYLCAQ